MPADALAHALFALYEPAAADTAAKYARSVGLRKYGWEVEDAQQSARLKLWKLARSPRFQAKHLADPGAHTGLVRLSVRRYLKRMVADVKVLYVNPDETVFRLLLARGRSWVEEFLADALTAAPPRVRQFLTQYVVEQETPLNRRGSDRSGRPGSVGRRETAAWLHRQLEPLAA